jgi:hypothetical protein
VRLRNVPRRTPTKMGADSLRPYQPPQASRVDPFRRRLPQGQFPSFEKVVEADLYGIDLAGPGYPTIKYTWVRPHTRGKMDLVPQYLYQDYRAVRVFETLLDAIEFSHESSSPSSQPIESGA